MTDEGNKRKLYDALSQDYDMGSFEQFSQDVEDEQKRHKLYDAISNEYDLPDFDGFSRQLVGTKEQKPQVEPVNQEEPEQTQPVQRGAAPVEEKRPVAAAAPKAIKQTTAPITTENIPSVQQMMDNRPTFQPQSVEAEEPQEEAQAEETQEQPQAQQGQKPQGIAPSTEEILAMRARMNNIVNQSKQVVKDANKRMENIRKGNKMGDTAENVFNPETGKWERKYYTTTGEAVDSPEAQSQINMANRDVWEATTEEGRRHRARRIINDYEERLGSVLERYDDENTAELAWQEAEEKTRAAQIPNPTGNSTIAAATLFANQVEHMKYHDLKRMADRSWEMLGKEKQQAIVDDIYDAMRPLYSEASDKDVRNAAKKMARQMVNQRLFELAVAKNAPQDATEYFFRKAVASNAYMKVMEALARSSAGTTGDMEARDVAEQIYGKNHKIAGLAGTVTGFAIDPLVWISAGAGSAATRGALWATGRALGTAAGRKFATSVGGKMLVREVGDAAARKFAPTLGGRLLLGAVGGAGNFATFEAGGEALEQARYGGKVTLDPETSRYIIGDYDAGEVGKRALHGAALGAATGVIAPMIGNVSDKLVNATKSTAGKLAYRAGELGVSTVAEGTIFSVPEWIEGKEDAMDVWTDNLAMMAAFKLQHGIKSAPRVIGELSADPKGLKAGFETRLRSILDGRTDLALTADEKRELKDGGYGDLSDLVDEYSKYRESKAEYDKGQVQEGAKLIENKSGENALPYNRFVALMRDGSISEAARAKMYYYITGRMLPMSTVMRSSTIEKVDADGNVTGYEVQSVGANGVITSRTFDSKERAEVEADKINRQAELNSVDVGERYADANGRNKRMYEACQELADEIGVPANKLFELVQKEPTDEVEREWKRMALAKFYEDPAKYTAEKIRNDINEEFGVDVDEAIKKEPNKRSDQEKEAVRTYLEKLFDGAKRIEYKEDASEESPLSTPFDNDDETPSDPIADAFQRGYDADEQERREISVALGAEQEQSAELQEAWKGVVQRINEDADYIAAKEREEAKQRQHADGTYKPVQLKDGTQAFVVDGNLATTDDGQVDVKRSDNVIVVFDPATGQRKQVNPLSSIDAVYPETSQEWEDATIEANKKAYIQTRTAEAQGVLPFVAGDNYNVVDEEGNPHSVLVMIQPADETPSGQILVSVDGGEPAYMNMNDIQAMADRASLAEVAQRAEEDMTPEPSEAEEQSNGLTAGAPAEYTEGTELVVRDEDGNESPAMVMGRVRLEGGKFVPDENGKMIEYLSNGEVKHDYVGDLNEKVVGYRATEEETGSEQAVVEASPEQTGGNEATAATTEEPVAETEPADTDAMPMNGEEPDFLATTPERGHRYLFEESGWDADEANQFIEANKKAADKALTTIQGKKPKMGTSVAKYNTEKAEWQAKVDAAQAAADYWNAVSTIEENRANALTSGENVVSLQGETLNADERQAMLDEQKNLAAKIATAKQVYGDYFDSDFAVPQDVNELVAMNMPKEKISWEGREGVRGLQQELGSNFTRRIGRTKGSTYAFNQYLAKKGEGISTDKAIHDIWESAMNQLPDGEKRWDTEEIRNAFIDMFRNAENPTDIRDYVYNTRIRQAEEMQRAEEESVAMAQMDEDIRQRMGMEREEYDAWIADMTARAEAQAAYETETYNETNISDDRRTEESTGTEGTGEVQGQEGIGIGTEEDNPASAGRDGAGELRRLTFDEIQKLNLDEAQEHLEMLTDPKTRSALNYKYDYDELQSEISRTKARIFKLKLEAAQDGNKAVIIELPKEVREKIDKLRSSIDKYGGENKVKSRVFKSEAEAFYEAFRALEESNQADRDVHGEIDTFFYLDKDNNKVYAFHIQPPRYKGEYYKRLGYYELGEEAEAQTQQATQGALPESEENTEKGLQNQEENEANEQNSIPELTQSLNDRKHEVSLALDELIRAEKDNANDAAKERKAFHDANVKSKEAERALKAELDKLSDEDLARLAGEAGDGENFTLWNAIRDVQDARAIKSSADETFASGIAEQNVESIKHKTKFNPDSFTSKDEIRKTLNGVYHDESGYGVVGDGKILYYDKRLYDKKNKGKVVATHKMNDAEKGDSFEGKYPDWRGVIETWKPAKQVKTDIGALLDFLAGAENKLKEQWQNEKERNRNVGSFAKWLEGATVMLRMPDGSFVKMRYDTLKKFAEGAENLGATSIGYTDYTKPLLAESKHGGVLAMPMNARENGIVPPSDLYYDISGKEQVGKTEDVSRGNVVEFNITTYNDEKEEMKNIFRDGGWEEEQIDEIFSFADQVADEIEQLRKASGLLDAFSGEPANPKREILKSNPDYAGSFDYSYDCVKKEAMNYVIEQMVALGKSSHLGLTQIEAIKKVLEKHGYLTPCVMCYVEGKRKLLKQSKETEQRWNAVADAAGLPQTFIGEPTELTDEQSGILRRLAEGKGIDKVDGGGERIPVAIVKQIASLMLGNDILRGHFDHQWLMTPSGYTNFYDKFASTGIMGFVTLGQYKGKGLLGITPFSLQSIAPDRLDELFNPVKWAKEGGLRQFSYEDARPIMFFDYFQQMMLLQAAHAPLQLYTKREMMPDLFGETGAMINQSLVVDVWNGSEEHRQMLGLDEKAYDGWLREHAGFIPKGVLDGSGDMGTLVPYYSKDSFPIEAAMRNAKDARFGGRVGNAVVAPSDAFIRWALDNPDIHQILAYHAMGTSPVQRALVGYDKATQYDRDYLTGDAHTNVNDVRNGIVVEGGKLKWNTLLRKYQREGKGAREAAQFYLDYCKENGIKPMFEKFADHPEYYKMLVDFRAYDEQGNSVKQKAVKATLPEGWQEKLSGYLGEQEQATEAVQGIASNEDLQRELQQATKYVSLEPAERETIEKILGEIYGKENIFMLGGEEFDKALDAATEDGKANALRDAGGVVYGFTVGGKIYLSTDLFNAHTPLHEHGHIYMSVLEQIQPKLHQRGIELWKGTDMWEKIRQHLETLGEDTSDSHILSELAAQFTGKENEKVISEMTGITDKNWLQRAMSWLKELWAGVKSAFSKWTGKDLEELTPEQFISMPFRAFYDPEERAKYIKNLRAAREMGMAADMEAPITKNDDAAYKEAVDNGDTESAQRMVNEAAEKAMPDTKVVDEKGEPMLMSHHTNAEGFYVFDRDKIGTGQGQAFLGFGFNFSKGRGNSTYGTRNISAYLDAKNPLRSDVNTLTKSDIRAIINELNEKNGVDRIEDSWGSMRDAVDALYEYGGDLDTYATLCMTYSGSGRDVMEAFEKRGFDSTIEYNDNGEIINAVVFNSNQIKSAEPVTYDDNGEVIPLSKRFNKESNDIRFHFVGEKGAAEADRAEGSVARIEGLATAKQMEADGKAALNIKLATGWERGKDGKWRYEIQDDIEIADKGIDAILDKARKELSDLEKKGDALGQKIYRIEASIPKRITDRYSEEDKAKYAKMRGERDKLLKEWNKALREHRKKEDAMRFDGISTTLGEMLGEDNELFKYYPEMKSMPVTIKERSDSAGEYDEGKIMLRMRDGMASTLLHEIQHAIQQKEGFARGGNVSSVLNDDEVNEVFVTEVRNSLNDVEDKLNVVRDAKDFDEAVARYAEERGMSEDDARSYLDSEEARLMLKEREYNHLFEMLGKNNMPFQTAFDYYRRIAGEVEARNVQARAGMTPEERRRTLASETEDILRGEQIVTYGDAGGSASIVVDKDEVARLDAEPKEVGYRNVVLNEDGTLGSPMANRLGKTGDSQDRRLHRGAGQALGVPYQGSKSRIARSIINDLPAGDRFVDLFSGGGAMTHAAINSRKYGTFHMNDINPKGQELFMQGVRGDWRGYDRTDMTEEEFNAIKGTPESLVWSFNGLGRTLAKNDNRNRVAEQVRRVQRLEELKPYEETIETSANDYKNVTLKQGDVVYADIPYENTDQSGYGKGKFNKQEFIEWAQAQDVPVFVSEYSMPDGWTEISSYNVQGMRGGTRKEKLFVQDKFADYAKIDRLHRMPTFYSNAERAVEGIKQEKATPEQWLAMITKAGGLKAGEDKWMGLSDWLKSQDKKSLTKQEVMDFIRSNRVEVEEVPYQEYIDYDDNPNLIKYRQEYQDSLEKYETEQASVNEEMDAFNDEMYNKYGEGWASDRKRMSEEDRKRSRDLDSRYNLLNDNELEQLAYSDMLEKYGDDFGEAFEIDYYGKLSPTTDMYGEGLSEAARHFLELDVRPINATRLDYTTEGLDNKREIALVVPSIESWNESDNIHFGDAGEGRAIAWIRFGETKGVPSGVNTERFREYDRKMRVAIERRDDAIERLQRYRGKALKETQKRLEEENQYIQELEERYKDVVDVKPYRVLVIDEIQSKRHQEGREKGYRDARLQKEYKEKRAAARKAYMEYLNRVGDIRAERGLGALSDAEIEEIKQKDGEAARLYSLYEEAAKELSEFENDNPNYEEKLRDGLVPDAPFDKNWHELAMKRMLRYAAENGYDKIAWTKGEQQAERYNIGNVVDFINVAPYEAQSPNEVDGFDVDIRPKNGDTISIFADKEGNIHAGEYEGKNLSDVVGKALSEKILSSTEAQTIEGEGLRIGAEGMSGFYDQILPRFMDKYGKKWGVKTGEVELPNVEEAGRKMWAVDVTPEMKESVMQGQPMFRDGAYTPSYEESLAASKAAGYTKKQHDAWWNRMQKNMRKTAEDWAKKMHIADIVDIYDSASDLDGVEGVTDEDKQSKGWFDPSTGRIAVILGNHESVNDVFKTILHEGVNHYGLRKLFGEQFDTFLDNVFANATPEIRKEITQLAKQNGWNFHTATEEYLGKLAEDTDFENAEKSGWWQQIKRWFAEMLRTIWKNGTEYMDKITDNELRYVLWRSYQNLVNPGRYRSIVETAKDVAKQYELGVGKFAPKEEAEELPMAAEPTDQQRMAYALNAIKKYDNTLALFKGSDGFYNSTDRKTLESIAGVTTFSPRMLDEVMGKLIRSGRRVAVIDEFPQAAESGEKLHRADNLQERITEASIRLAQNHEDDKQLRNEAMQAIGGNLSDLRKAMSLQREFDKSTVKRVTDLADMLMKNGYLSGMSEYETKRLLAAIKNSTGKEDINGSVQKVMDIMVDNQLKRGEEALHGLETIRGSKVDARGVEVQGSLDVAGQQIIKTFKDTRKFKEEDLENALASAQERMGSDDAAVAEEAANEYAGLQMAMEYLHNIADSKAEEHELRQMIKDYDGAPETKRDFVNSIEEAIRQNKIDRAQAYFDLVGRLAGSMRESMENAEAFKEAEKARVREIQHNANSDMQGRPSNEHYQPKFMDKFVNNPFVQFLFAPLSTFDQMLRVFGSKSASGEGYLWNRFMRGWVDARQQEIRGVRSKYAILDEKAKELFGANDFGDLIRKVGNMPKATVEFWNGGEMEEHDLGQGNLLYIYMVDKMLDGRMKLRKMGITEDDVENIKNALDTRLIELADWLQNEFLVGTRNEYNETHKRMFGAPMAAIEHYFPLKVLANARVDKEEDLDNPEMNEGISTKTGSIIKRRRNALALDVLNADALHVILDHVAQMEHWNAFAEFNRDLNTLRTYKRFRNQVQNMTTIYGSGKDLWKRFNELCQLASGTYRPKHARFDESAVNIAKGVTAAKVSFRMFTALKQLLSSPAYLSEARPDILAKNIAMPWKAWNWSMEHLPIFEERWKSRIAGDPRLMKTDADWATWRNDVVQIASKIGMSPNAFVDALTVGIGAHSIYETRKSRYKFLGYNDEQAEKRAIQDAEIAYNQTQQSSEGAFMSPMQVDRSWLSVMFTVFRNSSMAYQRQLHDALRNLKRNPLQRDESIEFMTKQLVRAGVDEEKASKSAKSMFNRQLGRDAVRVAVFGFIMQLAWNMGGYLPYLLLGDDDDEKDKMWDDVLTHTAFGSVEGLTGGDVLSKAGQMMLTGEGNPEYLVKEMPLASDAQDILREIGSGKTSEALTDMIGLIVQAGIGVNPQSITDAALAIMDACGGDEKLANEATIFITRVFQVPQSQIDKLYFDEINMSGEEAKNLSVKELAERYAAYKQKRANFFAPWKWNDEKALEKQTKKAYDMMKERLIEKDDSTLAKVFDNSYGSGLQKIAANEISKRMGAKDSKGTSKTDYGVLYKKERTYVDLAGDNTLQVNKREAKESGNERLEKGLDKFQKTITELEKSLTGVYPDDDEVMKDIRELRSRALDIDDISSERDLELLKKRVDAIKKLAERKYALMKKEMDYADIEERIQKQYEAIENEFINSEK